MKPPRPEGRGVASRAYTPGNEVEHLCIARLDPVRTCPDVSDLLGFIGIAGIFNYEPVKKDSLLLLYVLFVREGG